MATSLAAQLQRVSALAAPVGPNLQQKRATQPSILFTSEELANLTDDDAFYNLAIEGLEVLTLTDERFKKYKNDLFSHKSKKVNREMMNVEENNNINASINSYLLLLSGYLHLPPSLNTIEYLIRTYKIHVYNKDELILCALAYHETPAFVRIVQLIDTGNSKWKFLDGVKDGAPPPRKVIVDQCIRDKGVLEVVCNYASSSKKNYASVPVIKFCTALVFEVVSLMTEVRDVDSDTVRRILPFIYSGLQSNAKLEHKVGSLLLVGLLSRKVALSPKLINSLMRSICEAARDDMNNSNDLQLFRLSLTTLINLVQFKSVNLLPKKALDVLREIRNITEVLSGMVIDELNIDKFLAVLLESLIEYSFSSDVAYHITLISILEKVAVRSLVGPVVFKILSSCLKLSQRKDNNFASSESERWAKKLLMVLEKKYPSEACGGVQTFLTGTETQIHKQGSTFEILCKILDGNMDIPLPQSDSKIWISLHHSKAEVRCATLSKLEAYKFPKAETCEWLLDIQGAVLRQLHDKDLAVVRAALSLKGLPEIINSSDLFEALDNTLNKCTNILMSSSSEQSTLVCDVAYLCLENVTSNFCDQIDYSERISAMILPYLLIRPKTKRLNLKALELAKKVQWPLYKKIPGLSTIEKKLPSESISSINMETVNGLSEALSMHFEEYMAWVGHRCNDSKFSKALLYLVLMQTIKITINNGCCILSSFEAFFSTLKSEWDVLESSQGSFVEEIKRDMLDWDCRKFLDQLFDASLQVFNANVLICVFWRLLEALTAKVPPDGENNKWLSKLQDLFIFFSVSQNKHVFKQHLHFLVKAAPVWFLSRFFTEEGVPIPVQIESLHCFAFLCSQPEGTLLFDLLAESPSILVPLASDNEGIRIAAMGCIEELFSLCRRVDFASKKNGNSATWSHLLFELLGLMVEQKSLILSDKKSFSSFLTSLLGSSSHTDLPKDIEKRFDNSKKSEILAFILQSALKLKSYGKLAILSLIKDIGSAIMHVKEVQNLLSMLLEQHKKYYIQLKQSCQKLSNNEIDILCLLLRCCTLSLSSYEGHGFKEYLLKALQVGSISLEDPAFAQPCITVLENLSGQLYSRLNTETQELLFQQLVFLSRNASGSIQNATRGAMLRLHIPCSTIVHMLNCLLEEKGGAHTSAHKKRKTHVEHHVTDLHPHVREGHDSLAFISSILDILLLKKDMEDRYSLIGPLFKLLGKIFSNEWLNAVLPQNEKWIQGSSGVSHNITSTISYMQQTTLQVLEDIISLLISEHMPNDEIVDKVDVKLLVECAHCSKDALTRNHVFSLLTIITKVLPNKVLEHMLDILTILGKSAAFQVDNHSQHIFEDLISVVVPCWLSKMSSIDELLKVFISVLPEMADHRRLAIVFYLLRTLGEHNSLAPFIFLLFRTLISRKGASCIIDNPDSSDSFNNLMRREWEYVFAVQLCQKFSYLIWLPSLVSLLQKIGAGRQCSEMFIELLIAMQFILHKLQELEFEIKVESSNDLEKIQGTLEELMEQVVSLLQLVDAESKQANISVSITKSLKDQSHAVLRTITMDMCPSAFFRSIIKLLGNPKGNVQKKALGLLCETLKTQNAIKAKKKKSKVSLRSNAHWVLSDGKAFESESFGRLCQGVVRIIDEPISDTNRSVIASAVSALEVLAKSFPSKHSAFAGCLKAVAKSIRAHDLAVASSCLRTSGALVDVLGLEEAVAKLPYIMENLIKKSHEVFSSLDISNYSTPHTVTPSPKESFMMSLLMTLEAVLGKVPQFLNPYLGDIVELIVLQPEYGSGSDLNLKRKADDVRRLITANIEVRLALPSLIKIYFSAVERGDYSLTIFFNMLADLVGNMKKKDVGGYHVKIFDLCLQALDLRHQHPASIQSIDVVETSVINAMIALTMKLTVPMFKPLFVRTIEWAESYDEKTSDKKNIYRAISFYGLVNKLAENQRSLFVPHFKYLLEDCIRYLSDSEDVKSFRKKKKARITDTGTNRKEQNITLSTLQWHLRALVLSALHKCFLYDTGSSKFLDSENFQVLLKPVVSQLSVEPPVSLEEHSDVPSVEEVDNILVLCIGQMAVTAGSDLLWKPLNHEVLMQTRSDKVRAKILGLRIVRYLLQSLKEEYLIFLPETIPFFGELLEAMDPVKSHAQEIFKEMESMSGENLREYL